MVARQHNQLTAAGLQRHHKAVEHFAGVAGRCTGIKQIACDDQRIHLMLFNLDQQPVEKCLMFGCPTFVVEELPQMPVRSMNDAHDESLPL